MLRRFGYRAKSSFVHRTNIGIFGAMNVGKSTLMNTITQQNSSIVDPTPGTTSDTKVSFMEIHGLGPIRLMDTAGYDESGKLGEKKKEKVRGVIKTSDISIVVINPSDRSTIEIAIPILQMCQRRSKRALIVFNLFNGKGGELVPGVLEEIRRRVPGLESNMNHISIDLSDTENATKTLLEFLEKNWKAPKNDPLLPLDSFSRDAIAVLNIPMDKETPGERLLRPQAMTQEFFIRHYVPTLAYRMDLDSARSPNPEQVQRERERWERSIPWDRVSIVVTDSQAIDIVYPWMEGKDDINLTTFSIVMANFFSGGRINKFIEGLEAVKRLKPGDKVLICEVCNHTRTADSKLCKDIGLVQIPEKLYKRFGPDIEIDFSFGRSYEEQDLSKYKVIIHCGGCMMTRQDMISRLADLEESGIPIVNYGILLSWFQSEDALERVLKIWK